MHLDSCNSDVAGVNINGVGTSLGDNSGSQCSNVTLPSQSFTNETGSDETFTFWLQDNSCSNIYFSTGGHASLTQKKVSLKDAGPACANYFDPPAKGKANFTVALTFS
jgi:hypothetical protein